jgi:hypothetical protein
MTRNILKIVKEKRKLSHYKAFTAPLGPLSCLVKSVLVSIIASRQAYKITVHKFKTYLNLKTYINFYQMRREKITGFA